MSKYWYSLQTTDGKPVDSTEEGLQYAKKLAASYAKRLGPIKIFRYEYGKGSMAKGRQMNPGFLKCKAVRVRKAKNGGLKLDILK